MNTDFGKTKNQKKVASFAERRVSRNRFAFIRVHLCASVVSIPAVPLLTANEIRERLPAADHAETPAGNENFGGARPGIVV